ncbi:nucleotide-binding protein [Ruminiclostridium cellobioparum]|uniref:nucleotide-binding protein n=1 Tax=Ruminiclostridium cellobioparum TaxID=29355 RepID=UPI0028A80748|nr:nucleotide-binding protein [Ruminiclostridium cellobioparum]
MNIFIGSSSSSQSLDDLRWIARIIEREGHIPYPWNKSGVFPLGKYITEGLRDVCKKVNAAILIFNEDDPVGYRNDYYMWQPRDNVVYEYGLLQGQLGRERTIICRRGSAKLASDLNGIVYCDLDKEYTAEHELVEWMRYINSMLSLK